jgi:hypothetical protein
MVVWEAERKLYCYFVYTYLNTLEKYHIYEICKDNLHMNDTKIDIHNHIFKTLYRIYTNISMFVSMICKLSLQIS